jgi:hypothetical protein
MYKIYVIFLNIVGEINDTGEIDVNIRKYIKMIIKLGVLI